MNPNDLFIIATRKKLRFPYKGNISVEDLWDLSVEELDKIYKKLNTDMQSGGSLLDEKSSEDERIVLQIEVVKYIVKIKLDEQELAKRAVANKQLQQRILAIKANRENEKLESLSDEELDKMLESLR